MDTKAKLSRPATAELPRPVRKEIATFARKLAREHRALFVFVAKTHSVSCRASAADGNAELSRGLGVVPTISWAPDDPSAVGT